MASNMDEVLAQLKAASMPKPSTDKGIDLGSLSQMMGTVARKRTEDIKETAELKSSFVDPRSLPGRGLVVAGRSINDDAEADTLEREVAFLQSSDTSQRRAALSRVMLLAQNQDTPSGIVNRVWEAVSLELMKLMSDPVERIRDMAMRSLIAFLDRVTAVAHILPVAVPCLLHRMGTMPTEEPAEEVRLLLVLVLGRLAALLPKNIGAYMDAIQTVLECALCDVNPAVRKEACGIIVMLCRSQREQMRKVMRTEETRAGTESRHRYEDMIKSLKDTLRHKHASVRVIAVSALGALLMCGDKNLNAVEDLVAWHQPNIIPIWTFFSGGVYEDGKLVRPDERAPERNYLAVLATDKSPQVRDAFLNMLVLWMTRLTDRWDHEMRFLPYLLNGLTDEVPKMREAAFEAMERLGATHESEKDNNERDKQEIRDFREYGHKTPSEQNAVERWGARSHEPPFTRRPRLGARLVVRSNFRRLCPTLVRELNDWIPRTRGMAAQLLYYLTLYCEYWVTNEAVMIVEAIIKCIFRSLADMEMGDPDARQLLRQVLLLAATVGEFIDPSVYMPLLLPVVRGETDTDIHHRCAAIEVLGAMSEGCSPSWLRPHTSVIVRALDCPSIWESRDPRLSTQIARCAGQVAATGGSLLLDSDRAHLLRVVLGLQVKAWTFGAREVPPLHGDDGALDHYSRTWAVLQSVCTRVVRQIAASAGCSPHAYMAQQLADSVAAIMPVCAQYGLEMELALLEVCVRQTDVATLAACPDSFDSIVAPLRRLLAGKSCKSMVASSSSGGGDEGGSDDWVVVEEEQEAVAGSERTDAPQHASSAHAPLLAVQVDALVLLVHVLSDPSAVAPWQGRLAPLLGDVVALAGTGAEQACRELAASRACEDADAAVAAGGESSSESGADKDAGARGGGATGKVQACVLVSNEEEAAAAPAITVVGVGKGGGGAGGETREVACGADAVVVCQTALEAAYLALVPELGQHVCSSEVVARVEMLAESALRLADGNVRQLMLLVVASCVQAETAAEEGARVGRFARPEALAACVLGRVDDSKDDVRAEAMNCLAALVGSRTYAAAWRGATAETEGGLLDVIGRCANAVLGDDEEEEMVCDAARLLRAAVAAVRG